METNDEESRDFKCNNEKTLCAAGRQFFGTIRVYITLCNTYWTNLHLPERDNYRQFCVNAGHS